MTKALNEIPGVWALRINSGTIRKGSRVIKLAPRGTPDVLAVCAGACIFFEAKLPGERPTLEQAAMHERLRRAGGVVHTVTTPGEAVRIVSEYLRARC